MKHVKRHARKPEAYWANTAPLRATREWREHNISFWSQDTLVAELKLAVKPISQQTLETKAKQRLFLDRSWCTVISDRSLWRGGAVAANKPQIKSKPAALGTRCFRKHTAHQECGSPQLWQSKSDCTIEVSPQLAFMHSLQFSSNLVTARV